MEQRYFVGRFYKMYKFSIFIHVFKVFIYSAFYAIDKIVKLLCSIKISKKQNKNESAFQRLSGWGIF